MNIALATVALLMAVRGIVSAVDNGGYYWRGIACEGMSMLWILLAWLVW